MLEYSGAAAASAVIISHDLRSKKIVFVEGVQEGLLLECLFDENIKAISARGHTGVVEAVDTIAKYNLNTESGNISIIGFIDKDYHYLRDDQGVLKRDDIITTTNRDIEIDLLRSKATKRFLEEKANPSNWSCDQKVVLEIIQELDILSYLRAYNHVFKKKWDFKWIDLDKYTDKLGKIDYKKLISSFRQRNHISCPEWDDFELWRKNGDLCLYSITRGHDATCLLGKMLRKKLANRKKEETVLTVIEENLRLATEIKFVNIYQWFISIFEWAYN